MAFNPSGSGKNSSGLEGDDITCLGVTPAGADCSVEQKIQLLQRLRDQAGSGNSFGGGNQNFQQFNTFTGNGGPPTMVGLSHSGMGDSTISAPPKKKKKKKNKPPPVPQLPPVPDGDDLLKSSMCSLCQATFSRFTDLLIHHKEVHTADTNHPLRCRACGRTQTSEAGLIYHQVYVCKMVERPHQCPVCTLKFQSQEMMLVHKCSGCPRKRYACEFCDHYRTESSSDLEKHMRIHTNDKCYVCKICSFSTAWKKNLKEHMVKHLGLKPYVCDMCGYSTSDRHNLRSHRMKHYEKGEGCEKCGGQCHCNNKGLIGGASGLGGGSVGGGGGGGKKKRSSEGGGSNPTTVLPPTSKELECPYPQCVYRTKLEYMMANHMLRHQGIDTSGGTQSKAGQLQQRSTTGGGGTNGQYSVASRSTPSSTVSVVASSTTPATGVTNQVGSSTLIASSAGGNLPLEWKALAPSSSASAQNQVCGMLSPPAAFSPMVGHQNGQAAGSMVSWPTVVPAGLIAATNRVSVPVAAAQNMVARPMPVFPNMPN